MKHVNTGPSLPRTLDRNIGAAGKLEDEGTDFVLAVAASKVFQTGCQTYVQ
jgi:hypothetical protein